MSGTKLALRAVTLHLAEHMPVTNRTIACSLSVLALALLACQGQKPSQTTARPPAPLQVEGSAFALAGRVEIPKLAVEEHSDLHNVIKLSQQIVSGSEPHGRAALGKLRHMGIRTILSVDGKAPDVTGAQALGMRYVHVPIQYKGISEDQVSRIAKAFRELDGPFYVHCFHGKHRGPAAAAIGRVVLDGASRKVALAEMRQCGTAAKYEGLYRTLAHQVLPTAKETARSAGLLRRVGVEERVTFTGGVAKNTAMIHALQERLGTEVNVSDDSHYMGALGAALFALDHVLASRIPTAAEEVAS